jgi:hypothetical protein
MAYYLLTNGGKAFMRTTGIKLIGVIGLLVALSMVMGCGSSDLLDEQGQRYTANISVLELDSETLSVDVVQGFCESEAEDYGPASAEINIAADADSPGITLVGYTLEYIPLESEDGTGTIVTPPTLDSPLEGGVSGIDIESGGSAAFTITCMSVDTKEEYRLKLDWLYNTETVGGLALIAAKEDEITAKQTAIEAVEDEIIVQDELGNSTDGLELQLERLEAELEELQTELTALSYGFWSVPELDEARYQIRITLEFEDEYGQDRTIVRSKTVWLGNFNNC